MLKLLKVFFWLKHSQGVDGRCVEFVVSLCAFFGTFSEAGNQLEAMGLSQIIKVILGARLKLKPREPADRNFGTLKYWLC